MQNQKKTRAEMWQAIKFTLFSISAGVIQIGSFELFSKAFGWSYLPAYLTSLVLSVLWRALCSCSGTGECCFSCWAALL